MTAAASTPTPAVPERIDWSQFYYPGPKREFSAAELARAGTSRPSRTLVTMVSLNLALMAFTVLQFAPPQANARLTGLMAGLLMLAVWMARRLWQHPTRRQLMLHTAPLVLLCGVVAGLLKYRVTDPQELRWAILLCWTFTVGLWVALWFLVVYRSDQIAARLRELDERERAVALARQLVAAQIQPHFLFNSLASLQHWVQTKDDRAGTMLDALTGFLRSTLPLFDRERLALGDEAQAVQRYLEVMRLRLGERLRFTMAIEPSAAAAQIPPGLLLTLAENAVEHGAQASLSGAEIAVQAGVQGRHVVIEVRDTGPGPAPDAADGVGLRNSRERLAQAYGRTATLTLQPAGPQGGCIARIELPLATDDAT